EVIFDLRREWAAALVEFLKQIFHAVGQPRRRAEAHDAGSTLEGMDTAPHLLDVVVLCRGMAQAWQEAPDHVEMLLSFEEEAVDQLARYLIQPRRRRMVLEPRRTGLATEGDVRRGSRLCQHLWCAADLCHSRLVSSGREPLETMECFDDLTDAYLRAALVRQPVCQVLLKIVYGMA